MKAETKHNIGKFLKKGGLLLGGLVTSLAPLCAYIGVNYKNFVDTSPKLVSLTVGGIVAVVFLACSMLGKLKAFAGENKALVTYAVIFLVCLVLEPILAYAKWIAAMLFVGQGVNAVTFARWLKKCGAVAEEKPLLQSTAKTETKTETKKSKAIGGV